MKNWLFSKIFGKPKVKDRSCTFATSCWEGDYEYLLDREYLHKKIVNHCHLFTKKLLIINNVKDVSKVKEIAEARVDEGFFTDIFIAEEHERALMQYFALERSDFRSNAPMVSDDWVYYNALGALSAIYLLDTPYLLYTTGDVYLEKKTCWIPKAIEKLEEKRDYKVAGLIWNNRVDEAKRESYKEDGDFFVAKEGFSDQLFLVKKEDFKKPIYSQIRHDSGHFPRGDVFEKRVYSYMKNHHWKRLIYKHGSYVHEEYAVTKG